MKERAMPCRASMIPPILAGTKKQMRFAMKPQPSESYSVTGNVRESYGWSWPLRDGQHVPMNKHILALCPYGQVGDRLWVREAWRIGAWDEDESAFAIDYRDGPRREWLTDPTDCDGERFNNLWIECCDELRAKGIEPGEDGRYHWQPGNSPLRWRSSIHMPRWASRITLEVTGVRVERLQDISPADCESEGVRRLPLQEDQPNPWYTADVSAGPALHSRSTIGAYHKLWEQIKGPGSWAANPWVWVVEFKRIKP